MRHRRAGVRAATLKAAAAATGVVTILYLLIALALLLIVSRGLIGDADGELSDALAQIRSGPAPAAGEGYAEPPSGDRPGAPILVWTVEPDGTVRSASGVTLPARYRDLSGTQTVTINGSQLRLTGAEVGSLHVVVGESIEGLTRTRSALLVGEGVLLPIVLLLVFGGSLLVARRAALPIERARQRQMEFAADASHELRTPLSVITAQANLALGGDRDAAWYRRAFEQVAAESDRMRRLVEDLLWLARLEGAPRPAPEPVDLGVLAEQAVERFRSIAIANEIGLFARVHPAPPVAGNAEWLDRLLGVLIDNACRYTPRGGSVEVTVEVHGGRPRLAVDDSGPGIPLEERGRVFGRYERASGRTSGTGLGLAIADAVVRSTGGRWDVAESSLGGASITVTWPRSGS